MVAAFQRGAAPGPTLPPALICARAVPSPVHTIPPATHTMPSPLHSVPSPAASTKAMHAFTGVSDARLCRFDSSCVTCCAATAGGRYCPAQQLAAPCPSTSSSLPHPAALAHAPLRSRCPDPLPSCAVQPGHGAAGGMRAPVVSTPSLRHSAPVPGCPPKRPLLQSLLPRLGHSIVGPWLWESTAVPRGDAAPSAWPQGPSEQCGPTWNAVPAALRHWAGLLPCLCHQDFSICPTVRSGTH